MAKYVKPCRVCGKETACMVQATNFHRTEQYVKGVKGRYENCCPGCKEECSRNIDKYCSDFIYLIRLLIHHKITRKDWELQGQGDN